MTRTFEPKSPMVSELGFGLRSASGESEAEDRDERLANRGRSETARRRAADGSLPRLRLPNCRS
jgi:hypothetical protein